VTLFLKAGCISRLEIQGNWEEQGGAGRLLTTCMSRMMSLEASGSVGCLPASDGRSGSSWAQKEEEASLEGTVLD